MCDGRNGPAIRCTREAILYVAESSKPRLPCRITRGLLNSAISNLGTTISMIINHAPFAEGGRSTEQGPISGMHPNDGRSLVVIEKVRDFVDHSG